MSLIKIFIPFMLLAAIPVVVRLLSIYIQYSNSSYQHASGNSYFQTAFNKGNYGEFLTFRILEKLPGTKKVLTNLYIPREDGTTTEIDLVMINGSGLFVFESKNYSGWIYGDEKSKTWTQTLKNRQKNRFYNPIWQNNAHISALKNVLEDVESNLFHSYIIFSERCELKKVSVVSSEIRVMKRNRLLGTINKHMGDIGNKLTNEEIEALASHLSVFAHANNAQKHQHIANLRKTI